MPYAFCLFHLSGATMKQADTLKLNKDFRRLYTRGKSFAGGYVAVYCMKSKTGEGRIGLTTGKSIGNAVCRNRAKRLMRESYRQIAPQLKSGYDFVIVARNRIAGKSCGQVSRDLYYVMKNLGMIKTCEKER